MCSSLFFTRIYMHGEKPLGGESKQKIKRKGKEMKKESWKRITVQIKLKFLETDKTKFKG